MVRLGCFDSNGVAIETMYQWDVKRTVKITGVTINVGMSYELHFANRRMDKALSVSTSAESNMDVLLDSDGFILVDANGNILTVLSEDPIIDAGLIATIPFMLLEVPEVLYIYVVEINESTGERQTIGDVKIPIVQRQIPTDYVSTNINRYGTIANGLIAGDDGMIYLSADGVPFGDGIYI